MNKLYPCPYEKAVKCNLMDPCLGCETFAKHLKELERKQPNPCCKDHSRYDKKTGGGKCTKCGKLTGI